MKICRKIREKNKTRADRPAVRAAERTRRAPSDLRTLHAEKEERFRMDGTHLFKEFLAGIFHRGRDAADSELHRAL